MVDYKQGRIYKNEQISEFLGLDYEDIKELFKPMVLVCSYTEEEIEFSKQEYISAIKQFKSDYLLD